MMNIEQSRTMTVVRTEDGFAAALRTLFAPDGKLPPVIGQTLRRFAGGMAQ